jgi:hypothetical protein
MVGILQNVDDVRRLADMLARCPDVSRHDADDEPQGWTLASAFQEIEGSSRSFVDDLHRLTTEQLTPDQTFELLVEIGEEFRHVLYHVKETAFYAYLR